MAHDDDHLRHDVDKLLGQASALTCLINVKVKDRKGLRSRELKRTWNFIKKLNASELKLTTWVLLWPTRPKRD